jgi:hypothetical protein
MQVAEEELGGLDALRANAGIYPFHAPEELTADQLENFAVNITDRASVQACIVAPARSGRGRSS